MAEQLEAEFVAESPESTGNTQVNKRLGRIENLIPWKPGQSGNPNGRPRKKPLTEELEKLLSEIDPKDKKKRTYAKRLVVAIADEVIKKGNVAAFTEIADRIEGKVAQKQEHTGADGGPVLFETVGSRQEVEVKIAMLLEQARDRRGEALPAVPSPAQDSKPLPAAIAPAPIKALSEIQMEPVNSSNVLAIGYDRGSLTLLVRYKSQECYVWRGIPQDEYNALKAAESKGRYLNGIERRYGLGTKVLSEVRQVSSPVLIDGIDMDW